MARVKKNTKAETPVEEIVTRETIKTKEVAVVEPEVVEAPIAEIAEEPIVVAEEEPIKEEVKKEEPIIEKVEDKETIKENLDIAIEEDKKDERPAVVKQYARKNNTKYIFGYTWNGLTFDD